MAWDGLSRRQFPRAAFPCLLKLRLSGNPQDLILTHTENISMGGVCVTIKTGLERFASVEMEIDLMDSDDHIQCQGRVVWSVRRKAIDPVKPAFYDTGIEFIGITDQARDHIRRVVEVMTRSEQKARV